MDAAGVVESVGDGVDRLAPGDAVMAAVMPRRPEGGAQSELLVVPAASAVPLPDGADAVAASTLPMNGLTALLALELLDLGDGATLAVTGGAGLLASYVIPLARERGVRVLAHAGPADEALVAGFGAEVVARGAGFADAVRAAVPDGVDGLVDTALLGRAAFGAIRDGGAMAVVRGWDDSPTERGIEIRPVAVRTVLERTEWLDLLRERAADGRLTAARRRRVPARAGRRRAPGDGGGRAPRPRRHRLLRPPCRAPRRTSTRAASAGSTSPSRASPRSPPRRSSRSRPPRSAWRAAGTRSTASAGSAGQGGRELDVVKLRTMVSGAEQMGAKLAVDEGDTRITKVGAVLRRTSIDELPNLVNILRGEMSIVGPRPTLQVQVDQYTERQLRRLEARPGLTGWAQVNGRASLPWPERIELDIWYLENATLRLDLRIIALSARMAVTGHGLYRGETGGWRGPT